MNMQVEIGKNRTVMGHVKVKVTYTFIGASGDAIKATVVGEAMDSGDKATAKAMSVAFRTAFFKHYRYRQTSLTQTVKVTSARKRS
jgi:hypothetical protein